MSKKIIIIIMAMILFGSLMMAYRYYQKRYFSCSSQYYTNQKDLSMKAIVRMAFNGKQGVIVMSGEVKDEQGRHLALNRQMMFNFKVANSSYLMQSVKAIRENYDEVDDALMGQLINAFFYKENRVIQYKIARQPNGDLAVLSGKVPVAWCHNT
ncbi:hypothetical protein FEM41_16345 [Jejubacter calystegiae]|uniref:Uncharacterized protein n=1 Tax=Jejubacter calystegiae TaxID=2579935 RepID=A0A4P8YLN8_9ENTR|nr:hypothetical protein [Jejubacter calystegiae]QCT21103.1 hypothetical protein FEM41_16345 [Jejubacter calystegiae]